MKAAIIAAGLGERLTRGGIDLPKPLVRVANQPLISRVIHSAARLKVSSIACIVNGVNSKVADFLRDGSWPVPLELIVKTTPSSMESLFALAPLLNDEPFFLFTVDAVFGQTIIAKFYEDVCAIRSAHGVLALTQHVDDEKPLWADIDRNNRITAMGEAATGSQYVTAGFYYFMPDIFALIDEARERQMGALRQFLGLLLERGYDLCGVPVAKTIDVDHPEDIAKAEAYLKEMNEI